MATIMQLIRGARNNTKKVDKKSALDGCCQKKGVVVSVGTTTPKKPNSAIRKIAKVRLRNGRLITAYIPGEKHNIQAHSVVLVRGAAVPDLIGVNYSVIRGTADAGGVIGRKQGRSIYGTKKAK